MNPYTMAGYLPEEFDDDDGFLLMIISLSRTKLIA
jgi:hypothetical protein